MKHSTSLLVALLCLASPVLADGPAKVTEDPVIFPPPPDAVPDVDWTGLYAGLSLGRTSSDASDSNPDRAYDVSGGSLRSAFLGYRMQQGKLVYGAEAELSNLSGADVAGTPRSLAKAYDLKGTVGYATGKFLTYGVLAWSQVEISRPAGATTRGGIGLGAGVAYSISDRFGMGLEYMSRNVDGNSLQGAPQTTDIGVDSLSLRFSLSF
jgi:opacity protein-like surface antigen